MDNTEVKIKFSNSVTNLSSLEKYAQSLEKLKTFLNSIDSNDIVKIEDATKTLGNTAGKNKKKFETAFDIQVLKQFGRKLEQLVTSLSSYTKKSADFLENWNLLDVAFQNNTEEAEKLVDTLSNMYGLDESWGYRTVGLFKQLANAMGLTDEVGTQLSKTLTQLAIDTSSLYNIDVEDTVSILQSGLAGQTKPVRRLGADITQTTLQVTLDSYGINETINELSYAEKRLVIVTALLNQTEEAQGDWGRTIESTANQMRIFDQQLARLTRALGDALMPLLKTLLPIINGILMVIVDIVQIFASFVENVFSLFGYEPENDFFEGINKNINNFKENMNGASESAKKLQSGLRSFDKLNNIKTPQVSTGSVGGGVDPRILEMFNEASSSYLENLDKIQMKATRIRDTLRDWLGITVDENGKLKISKITVGNVLTTMLLIYGVWKSIKGILRTITFFKGFGKSAETVIGKAGKAGKKGVLAGGSGLLWILGILVVIAELAVITLQIIHVAEELNKLKQIRDIMWEINHSNQDHIDQQEEKIMNNEKIGQLTQDEFLKNLSLLQTYEDVLKIQKERIESNKKIWGYSKKQKEELAKIEEQLKDNQNKQKEFIDTWGKNNKIDFELLFKTDKKSLDNVGKTLKNTLGNVLNTILGKSFGGGGGASRMATGGIYKNGEWHDITNYATGGLPPVGQMFVAREKGPELVGTINGSTAVMNNDQIVSSVSDGVYQAVRSAMSNNGGQVFNIYLDENHKLGTYTLSQLQDMAKSNGKPITIG